MVKDQHLRLCITNSEYVSIIEKAHAGQASGHFSVYTTAKEIMMAGIWCPMLFLYAKEYVKHYNVYRTHPLYRTQAQYIIVATYYLTKKVEAKSTQKNDARMMEEILYELVLSQSMDFLLI